MSIQSIFNMRKLWLIFAQTVTACLGLLFVLRLFYPQFLETKPATVVIKQPPATAATSHQNPAKIKLQRCSL
jgi:hypothetical protein